MPTISWSNLPFNPKPSTIMHIDLNSAFASIEQQCDPFLRGKPVAVAAYTTPRGCIVAPSVEAKRCGVKVGMQVQQGQKLCRDLVVLPPSPDRYRSVHLQMKRLLGEYTDQLEPKSIDEFILDLEGCALPERSMFACALEIKERIKREIGDALTVSVGIAPNRFLAKTAAGLHKPDGLDEICEKNFHLVYSRLNLMDLCGIKQRNCARLNQHGIFTVLDFYNAQRRTLEAAFESINGFHWYCRLRGWDPDDVIFDRHSFGNAFALPQVMNSPEELAPVLMKLVVKTGQRMRSAGYKCRGVHVAVLYDDGAHWHRGMKLDELLFDSRDLYRAAFQILCQSPYKHRGAKAIAESVYALEKTNVIQSSLFGDAEKKERLVDAVDAINRRWGSFVITPALMLAAKDMVLDRISFGSVKDLVME